MNRWIPCLLLTVGCAPLVGQRIESLSQGDAVRQVWQPVVARANRSVVEVLVDGEVRALGTVVDRDLVVTKYSELPAAADELTCRQGEGSWKCARVGFDRPADLVLLRLQEARLAPVEWQLEEPVPGAFLACPDGTDTPRGVGILAAAPYRHTRPRAFLGIRFANPTDGEAEIAEAIEHGAARAAGLRGGDVVVHFGGEAVAGTEDLRNRIRACKPGDKVEVKVRRGDAEHAFEVTLGTNSSPPTSGQEGVWGDLSSVRSGFAVVLQHDAVLKPRDCGGPLVGLDGMVLGVNIARAGRVETLALPAQAVQRLVVRLQQAKPPKD